MNPLNRKMFRQPGMSRQPMGILASSPELANVVRRRTRQPVQMAHGGYHPPGDPMGRLSTSRRSVPGSVRIPLIDLLPKSGFARPALDDFLASSGAARASAPGVVIPSGGLGSLTSPPVMSARGSGPSRPAGATNVTSVDMPRSGMGSIASRPVMSVRGTGNSVDASPLIDQGIAAAKSAVSGDYMRPLTDAIVRGVRSDIDALPEAKGPASPPPALVAGQRGNLAMGMIDDPSLAPPPPPEKPPSDAELAAAQAEGMSRRGDFPDRPSGDLPKAAAETNKPAAEDAETALVTDPADLIPKLSQAQDDPKNKTAKQKADATDSILNIKNLKERKALLKNLLGEEKAKDIRTDAGYNLMMTGLLIAAGQSEDAMTNIAKGLAGGLQGFGTAVGEEAQAQRKLDRDLSMLAYSELSDEQKTARAAEIRARELAEERDFRRELKDMPSDTLKIVNSIAETEGVTLGEAAMLYKKAGRTVKGMTDTELLTNSLQRIIAGQGTAEDRARLLASSAGQSAIKDAGSIEDAAKELLGDTSTAQQQTTSGGFKLKQ